jgi:xanthine dehydrogenase YagS FAD-binding subunit
VKNFTYHRPSTLEEAVSLLDAKWGTTELLAGGTDLLDLQKEYVAQPSKVVGLSGIKGFEDIDVPPAVVGGKPVATLGAGVKLAAIAGHAELKKLFPALTGAAGDVGGPQIQNMGTLGGNLCQRNRCWYFRDEGAPCLLKGGKKCFATDGENEYHAIFTKGHKCVIVNPSTLAPALIALGAEAVVLGAKGSGTRTIPLAKFFQAPVDESTREHVLAANEVVTKVTIPIAGFKNANYEVRQKLAYDWPLAQAAVAFKLSGGKATEVRIVLGHVAPTPEVSAAAAAALEGKEVTEATAAAAGKEACKGTNPLAGNAYKVQLLETAVKRAILLAAGVKPYWE